MPLQARGKGSAEAGVRLAFALGYQLRQSGKELFLDDFLEIVGRAGAVGSCIEIGEYHDRRASLRKVAHEALKTRNLAIVTDNPTEDFHAQPIRYRIMSDPASPGEQHPTQPLFLRRCAQQLAGSQRPGPDLQIVQRRDRRPRRPSPRRVQVGHVAWSTCLSQRLRQDVAVRVWGRDCRRGTRRETATIHAKRCEDTLLEDLLHWHASDLLDEHSKEDVVRIRVVQALAGGEVWLVPEGDGDQILRVPHLAWVRLIEAPVIRVVEESTGHIEQLTYGDVGPFGHLRQVLRHRVVESKLAFID